jgi:hypothetical protein
VWYFFQLHFLFLKIPHGKSCCRIRFPAVGRFLEFFISLSLVGEFVPDFFDFEEYRSFILCGDRMLSLGKKMREGKLFALTL